MAETDMDAATVEIFPPAMPTATIVLGAVLQWLWPIPAGAAFAGATHRWIGALIVVAALALAAWAIGVMVRSGQSVNPTTPTPELIAHGPFAFSRNPMYVSMLLLCIGFAVLVGNLWILLLTPVCGWLLQRWAIRPEEEYLQRKFGQSYRAYRRRVRRWL